MIMLGNHVVKAKQEQKESIPVSEVYDIAVDALTLSGNSVFEFSMKWRELLKSEVAPTFKSLCHESQPITTMLLGDELPKSIRNISQVKRMAAKSVIHGQKRRYDSKSSRYEDHLNSRHPNYRRPPSLHGQSLVTAKKSGMSTKQ